MDLPEKIRSLPASPGVYLYKNAEGEVIYVGKAKNLRSRVSSYFHEGRWEDAKTGTLVREAVDVDYIVVANNKEALALENHLIKQKKPRFNILLRDDKTYPYVKLTLAERFPRVYVTRRLRKDGSAYYGPYFPANLAYRIVDLIHRHFLIPSCKVDLTRNHPRPCLQFYIKRCLGPCVKELTTPEIYAEAVRDVKLFLEGRQTDLVKSLRERMAETAEAQEFERAARYRDLISTVEQLQEKQRIAAAEGDDADVFGYHYENQMLAVNLFHMRGGKVLDRREFFWEDLPEFDVGPGHRPGHMAGQSARHHTRISSRRIFLRPASSSSIWPSPTSRATSTSPSTSKIAKKWKRRSANSSRARAPAPHGCTSPSRSAEISASSSIWPATTPSSLTTSVSASSSRTLAPFKKRFRTRSPYPSHRRRIECFDISHIQGAETVASMVVWEDGRMKKSDYRKFIIKTVAGVDDFASMREVVTRRYRRLCTEKKLMPSLVLIDGGLGQLHAAAQALEALEIINQPLAAIAKREEIIYVYGQEDDPVVLDHHSPVLHLVQMIRDEAHRFAVTFHRKRRQIRDRATELREIPGVGESTTRRLLEHFGSLQAVKQADVAALSAVVTKSQAEAILEYFRKLV